MPSKNVEPEISPDEATKRKDEALKRLLSMPPQPKPRKDASATPKKRGRPARLKKPPPKAGAGAKVDPFI